MIDTERAGCKMRPARWKCGPRSAVERNLFRSPPPGSVRIGRRTKQRLWGTFSTCPKRRQPRVRGREYDEGEKGTRIAASAASPLCAVKRRRSSVGAIPTRQLVASAGSNRSGSGGNDTAEAFDAKGRRGRLCEQTGRNASERQAGLEKGRCGSRPSKGMGKAAVTGSLRGATTPLLWSHRGNGDGMSVHGDRAQHGKPQAVGA
jgi:hypothetical protein